MKASNRQMLIESLLNDRSYHIEFNGHLTNHSKHAVIALAGLGASAERIKSYYDAYAKRTPYGPGLEAPKASSHVISEENWERFLGKRTSYSSYCHFFDRREKELGLDALLRQYIPTLLPGWVGSFTHAAIHLGWALDEGNRWMAIEGLAYMAFSYVTCHPHRAISIPRGRSENDQMVDAILRIAGIWEVDRDTMSRWAKATIADAAEHVDPGIHPELVRSGLQYRIAKMLGNGHPLIYTSPAALNEQDMSELWAQLYYVTTLLYLAQPGDFVLLHLITSLHAMEQIAERLPTENQRDVVQCFWIGMLCILFSRGDFPRQPTLEALHLANRDTIDIGGHTTAGPEWKQAVARAICEDEEHNPKLVYVL